MLKNKNPFLKVQAIRFLSMYVNMVVHMSGMLGEVRILEESCGKIEKSRI